MNLARRLTLVSVISIAGCTSTGVMHHSARPVDIDGDGRADRFDVVADDGSVERIVRAPVPGSDPPETLVVAIDGVPYEVFAELQAAGRFEAFFPASRMIAPFPSLTNVAFTDLLQTAPALGYEDRFYDGRANRLGGGILDRLTNRYKDVAGFHDLFDWEEPHLWGGAAYLVPERVSMAELHLFEELLRTSSDPELIVYLGSTDALGHMRGRAGLRDHLERIADAIDRFIAGGGGSKRIVLFSDHAMSEPAGNRFDLESALQGAGFRLVDRIEARTDVVAPDYGLVGSVQLFTVCGVEPEVARRIASAPGVDFVAWSDDGAIGFADRSGGALSDRAESRYPDLEHRLAHAIGNHTLYPASVLVSLEDGWYYGSRTFDRIVELEGTHGSAGHTSSVGFLASNLDRTPPTMRAEGVYPYLGIARLPVETSPTVRICYGGEQDSPPDAAPVTVQAESGP